MWEAKMQRTRERDAEATELATSLGWHVVRIWEHEVRANPAAAASRVLEAAGS